MSCVLVSAVVSIRILAPGLMVMPSLYHMTVASGMAAMVQVSVTVRPVRARCGPLTAVTSAGSEPRTEMHSFNMNWKDTTPAHLCTCRHTISCTCTPLPKHSAGDHEVHSHVHYILIQTCFRHRSIKPCVLRYIVSLLQMYTVSQYTYTNAEDLTTVCSYVHFISYVSSLVL